MAGDSTTSARSSSSTANPLRRRIHLLERAASASASHRSFSVNTADSSTRNGDAESEDLDERSLLSPPTSFEAGYDEDEDGEEEGEGERQGDDSAEPLTELQEADEDANEGDGDGHGEQEEEYTTPDPRPWYKPSVPVLLALAPPIGNWLTGGDHLKDLLLLLLLVFYLHQLVEVPWSLYHAARPRRPPPPSPSTSTSSSAPTLPDSSASRARAKAAASSLRTFELLLLLTCLLTPLLGVVLLRSLSSFTTGTKAREPISWFSTTLFALLTAIRPLRELVSHIASRTSSLHTIVHSSTSPSTSTASLRAAAEVADLKAKVERLERALEQMAEREEAMYAYVEDALAPLEKGVRRVERRVGKLRAAKKELVAVAAEASTKGGRTTTTNNTIFVPAPAPARPTTVQGLIGSWFSPLSAPTPAPARPASAYASAPISPTNGTGKRRALDSIPEEPAEAQSSSSSTFYPARAEVYAKQQQHAHVALIPLLRQWLASCVALALYPLYLVLLPVRGVMRAAVGGA